MIAPAPVRRFQRFNLVVLGYTLAVILWGAYVRASGSGAGCGSHWPTCNGNMIPRSHSLATVIEYSHRVTSALSLALIVTQMLLAWRTFPSGHRARRAANASALFIFTEALVGGGLVLFEMVAHNKSMARVGWLAAHLINTFALVAAITLTGFFARAAAAPRSGTQGRGELRALYAGLAATVLVAVSGAIVALGDTLFPARSLREGWAADFSPRAHALIRLRVWHPALAVTAGLYLLVVSAILRARADLDHARTATTALAALILCQLAVGLFNFLLLAPTGLQIVHLLMADLVWIALVWLTASVATHSPAAGA